MLFRLMSDIHLEFADMVLPALEKDNESILLLAGDITCAYLMEQTNHQQRDRIDNFFYHQCARFKHVYYIMGNHEYYSGNWFTTPKIIRTYLSYSKNITFLNNQWASLDENIVLWGGTLWTDMKKSDPLVMLESKKYMQDYTYISLTNAGLGTESLKPEHTVREHYNALKSLEECIKTNPDKKIIVMSHMAPSLKSVHLKWGMMPTNHAFFTELSEFILNNPRIITWVHGHTHDSFDYNIGETRVMCNPRGYAHPMRPNQQENPVFNPNFTFEV
jgi:predicted phosphodiesterase